MKHGQLQPHLHEGRELCDCDGLSRLVQAVCGEQAREADIYV